jgi:Zn-dependent protease
MPSENGETDLIACPKCATQIAPALLSCPGCRHLVHAEELKQLADSAQRAEQSRDVSAALVAWRRALELLPSDSRQHALIVARVTELDEQIGHASPTPSGPAAAEAGGPSHKSAWTKGAAGIGAVGLLLWKFKFILAMAATKGKFLLLGLTKASTLFSMLVSLGVYWAAWGWWFALGLVISIYIHEMGHVAALRRYGLKASAPMFIPGLGAVVRLQQRLVNAREDARVGLAGPIWGLAAAVGFYGLYLITGWLGWAAIARVGAWINLFNLIPVWQLDGARGFRSLSRSERWLVVIAIGIMWYVTGESLLLLLLIVAAVRASATLPTPTTDRTALVQFVSLVVLLSAMCLIPTGLPTDAAPTSSPPAITHVSWVATKRWFGKQAHTHVALDDAVEQGVLFCNMHAERSRLFDGNAES